MAASVLVDAGFVIALLSRRDTHHRWATAQATEFEPPWATCEAALSEAFHLLGSHGGDALSTLLRREALSVAYDFADHREPTLRLMAKYAAIPMSLANACLVRMTETLPDPWLLTTDADFRIYRRHSRQMVPCVMPPAARR
jgi:predicted nucleic acid-binding protein